MPPGAQTRTGPPENFVSSYLSIFHKRFAKKADVMSRRTGKKKAFARGGERLFNWIGLSATHTRPRYFATLRFVDDYLRRGFAHLDLGAHFLDLRGLLFQLRCEDFHSFLLLRNG